MLFKNTINTKSDFQCICLLFLWKSGSLVIMTIMHIHVLRFCKGSIVSRSKLVYKQNLEEVKLKFHNRTYFPSCVTSNFCTLTYVVQCYRKYFETPQRLKLDQSWNSIGFYVSSATCIRRTRIKTVSFFEMIRTTPVVMPSLSSSTKSDSYSYIAKVIYPYYWKNVLRLQFISR